MRLQLGRLALVAALGVAVSAGGCGTTEKEIGTTAAADPSFDDQVRVPDDLARLAEAFVSYAVGDANTFPHRGSITVSLGGEPVFSIDDVAAALRTRRIWRVCPVGSESYGAWACPVDILAPVINRGKNDESLVYSGEHGDLTCALARTGPLPSGRLVVLRPDQESRTCLSDFALVLAADRQGRLRSVDLTVSDP